MAKEFGLPSLDSFRAEILRASTLTSVNSLQSAVDIPHLPFLPEAILRPVYYYEKVILPVNESKEDVFARFQFALSTALQAVTVVSKNRPLSPLVLEGIRTLGFVREPPVTTTSLAEAAINAYYDETLTGILSQLAKKVPLDRTTTVKTLLALREIFPSTFTVQRQQKDLSAKAGLHPSSVWQSAVIEDKAAGNNINFIFHSPDGENLATFTYHEALSVIAQAIYLKAASGDLSESDTRLVKIAEKLNQSGIFLSNWQAYKDKDYHQLVLSTAQANRVYGIIGSVKLVTDPRTGEERIQIEQKICPKTAKNAFDFLQKNFKPIQPQQLQVQVPYLPKPTAEIVQKPDTRPSALYPPPAGNINRFDNSGQQRPAKPISPLLQAIFRKTQQAEFAYSLLPVKLNTAILRKKHSRANHPKPIDQLKSPTLPDRGTTDRKSTREKFSTATDSHRQVELSFSLPVVQRTMLPPLILPVPYRTIQPVRSGHAQLRVGQRPDHSTVNKTIGRRRSFEITAGPLQKVQPHTRVNSDSHHTPAMEIYFGSILLQTAQPRKNQPDTPHIHPPSDLRLTYLSPAIQPLSANVEARRRTTYFQITEGTRHQSKSSFKTNGASFAEKIAHALQKQSENLALAKLKSPQLQQQIASAISHHRLTQENKRQSSQILSSNSYAASRSNSRSMEDVTQNQRVYYEYKTQLPEILHGQKSAAWTQGAVADIGTAERRQFQPAAVNQPTQRIVKSRNSAHMQPSTPLHRSAFLTRSLILPDAALFPADDPLLARDFMLNALR